MITITDTPYKKMVLVTVPRISPTPHLGVRLLDESLTSQGIDSCIFDANLDMHIKYHNHVRWQDIEKWAIQEQTFWQADSELQSIILENLQSWTDYILSLHPTHVGITVFTHESRNWTTWLCYYLRNANPNITIIIGGRGINNAGRPEATFAEELKSWELIDLYFNGEAEKELSKFMLGRPVEMNVVDKFHINDDLDRAVTAFSAGDAGKEYSRFLNNWYEGHDDPSHDSIILTSGDTLNTRKTFSTRGCIKTCTFCDVHLLRPKFSIRSAQNLFDELRDGIENHQINSVVFSDEMINGSNRQFLSWLDLLANYLENNNITNFKWISQFGIKSKKSTPIGMFPLLHRTGANLAIGLDHFSNQVLEHMKKQYTDDDIFWYLENFCQNPVIIHPLLIMTGYPTETLKDFEIQKQGISNLVPYKKVINIIDLGTTCGIPLGSELEKLPGMHLGSTGLDWVYDSNPELTGNEKLRRRVELDNLVESLGFQNRKKRTYWLRMKNWIKK
jgi:hypothetical protein